ncbi:hypothetical protein, partial [Streptomyces galilaeus]|uniref:hypothetical protein n=1 Tax=Streptomyces galilaeus TaxID=33899 RepID=UPI0038F5E32F
GRMPIRNSDGSVGYLEKGLWSLQPPAGYGYFPYQATYANGATQQVYLSKQELNQGTQTNAGNPQTLLSQKGGEANSYAVIQEDQSTYVVLPA